LRSGPIVWVHALTHGDEFGGARAIQQIVASLEPKEMSGTVIAGMVTNSAAFRALRRVNPNLDDGDDLGRIFPGGDRFATQRVAAAITAAVRGAKTDYFLDLHTGGDRFRQLPFILYTPGGSVPVARYDSLAALFGVRAVWRDTLHIFPGGPTTAFSAIGIPSFLLEIGGGQPIDSADTNLQAEAVRSFLRGIGVLSGDTRRLDEFLVMRGYRVVTNARGGFFEAAVKPGDSVVAGGKLGTITNVFGEIVETLTAPTDAIVIGVSTYPAWPSGGWLIELGTGVILTKGRPRG
jgi:predicted deacylase